MDDEYVDDKVFNKASKIYHRKRQSLAAPFRDGLRRMAEGDQENKPERVFVDFSDGRRALRALVRVEDALESAGLAINDAIEQSAMLTIIDARRTDGPRAPAAP